MNGSTPTAVDSSEVSTRPLPRRSTPHLRVQALIGATRLLTRLRILPDHDRLLRMPPADRKALKPPKWAIGSPPHHVAIEDRTVPGRAAAITVRVYRPTAPPRPRPVVLYLHGGGWVSGGLDSITHLCADLAAAVPATVISVDYRLAPECPHPQALYDCHDALDWVAAHTEELDGDVRRIVVMGDSAGGNLAAALCLRLRGTGPPIALQVLVYPALDATLEPDPDVLHRMGLTPAAFRAGWNSYRGHTDPTDPLVSPLLAPDLSGLPPTLIQVADTDVLRDDGERYAHRLTAAGVPVRYTNYLRAPHGFYSLPRLCPAAEQGLWEVAQIVAGLPR